MIDSVLFASHCLGAVTRLLESPTKIQRILVSLEVNNLGRFAVMVAAANQTQVTLIYVSDATKIASLGIVKLVK